MDAVISLVGKYLLELSVGLYNDVSSVRGELITVQDHLKALSQSLKILEAIDNANPDFIDRIANIKQLGYDIHNCLEEFAVEPTKWLEGFKRKYTMANRLKSIKTQLIKEDELLQKYKLNDGPAYQLFHNFIRSIPVYAEPATEIVSCGTTMERIASAMLTDDIDVKVVSVIGTCGSGKTTLAMGALHAVSGNFDCSAIIHVSKHPDRMSIFQELMLQLDFTDLSCEKSELTVLKKIKDFLMKKRYLIMLDDIWSKEAWEAIRGVLPLNSCRSRIIVTTRITSVAKACSSEDTLVIHTQALDYASSKKLFLKKAGLTTCPPLLEEKMNIILRRCEGIPLVIVSVAAHLREHGASRGACWDELTSALDWHWEDSDALRMMDRLTGLSFINLPSHLKNCTLFLSGFMPDEILESELIIQCWIAEGFVIHKPGVDLCVTAQGYLADLADWGIITPISFQRDESITRFQIPVLIKEMIDCKAGEQKFFTKLPLNVNSVHLVKPTRLSITCQSKSEELTNMYSKNIRTLLLMSSVISLKLNGMKYLRVLIISNCGNCDNLSFLGKLSFLKVLAVQRVPITELPCSGNVPSLQYLSLHQTKVKVLPDNWALMSSMISIVSDVELIPSGLGQMTGLQRLEMFNVCKSPIEAVQELACLKNLKLLHLYWRAHECMDEEYGSVLASSLQKLLETGTLKELRITAVTQPKFLKWICINNPDCSLEVFCVYGALSLPELPIFMYKLQHVVSMCINVEKIGYFEMMILASLSSLGFLQLWSKKEGTSNAVLPSGGFQKLSSFHTGCGFLNLTFEPGCMTNVDELQIFCLYGLDLIGAENLINLKTVGVTIYSEDAQFVSDVQRRVLSKFAMHPSHPVVILKTPFIMN